MKKIILLTIFALLPFFTSAANTVEINTASLAQLDTLTGIGPKYAQAIIDARPFSSLDDLLKVKGIGPKTLQKIKDQGFAYVGGQAPATEPVLATNEPAQTPAPIIYPTGVFINEILPSPAGSDETDEWIELYNSNNSDIDLSGWQLQDTVGTIAIYIIPDTTKILGNSYLVFKRPTTKIMLNNDQDGINLLTPDKKVVDSVNYSKAPTGQSYNRTLNNWIWSTSLTAGAPNIVTSVAKVLPKTKNSVKNDSIQAEDLTAELSRPIPPGASPWPMFLIVLGSTLILAVIVLLIKFKFKNNVRT